jgi:hypothetical protein
VLGRRISQFCQVLRRGLLPRISEHLFQYVGRGKGENVKIAVLVSTGTQNRHIGGTLATKMAHQRLERAGRYCTSGFDGRGRGTFPVVPIVFLDVPASVPNCNVGGATDELAEAPRQGWLSVWVPAKLAHPQGHQGCSPHLATYGPDRAAGQSVHGLWKDGCRSDRCAR